MTDKHNKGGNIILNENDTVITDKENICETFNNYFVNIASSIGYDDKIVDVKSALTKHASHPSILKIKKTSPNHYCVFLSIYQC